MPHLITAHQGQAHIESSDYANQNAAAFGPGSYAVGDIISQATMPDSNTLRISFGTFSTNGRFWAVRGDYEEVIIENGTPGMKRIDLVVARITTAPNDSIEYKVIKGVETSGTAVKPTYEEGNLREGDTVVEMPLYSVPIDGINPGTPVHEFEVLPSLAQQQEAWDSIKQDTGWLTVGDYIRARRTGNTVFLSFGGCTFSKDYAKVATLPENMRPSYSLYVTPSCNDEWNNAIVNIRVDGVVNARCQSGSANGIYGVESFPL